MAKGGFETSGARPPVGWAKESPKERGVFPTQVLWVLRGGVPQAVARRLMISGMVAKAK